MTTTHARFYLMAFSALACLSLSSAAADDPGHLPSVSQALSGTREAAGKMPEVEAQSIESGVPSGAPNLDALAEEVQNLLAQIPEIEAHRCLRPWGCLAGDVGPEPVWPKSRYFRGWYDADQVDRIATSTQVHIRAYTRTGNLSAARQALRAIRNADLYSEVRGPNGPIFKYAVPVGKRLYDSGRVSYYIQAADYILYQAQIR